jgi:hypothetical protein
MKSIIKSIVSIVLILTVFFSINISSAKNLHLKATKIWIVEAVKISVAPPSVEREIKREIINAAYNIEKNYSK